MYHLIKKKTQNCIIFLFLFTACYDSDIRNIILSQ